MKAIAFVSMHCPKCGDVLLRVPRSDEDNESLFLLLHNRPNCEYSGRLFEEPRIELREVTR